MSMFGLYALRRGDAAREYLAMRSLAQRPSPSIVRIGLTMPERRLGFGKGAADRGSGARRHRAGQAADGIVCRCAQVSRDDVACAVAGGAATLDQLEAATGCSTVCGGCRDDVQSILVAAMRSAEAATASRPWRPGSRSAAATGSPLAASVFADQLVPNATPETIRQRLGRQAVVADVLLGLAVLFLACLVGVVAVPVAWASGLIGSAAAAACGLFIAAALVVDTRESFLEWRRIFHEEAAEDADAGDGTTVPAPSDGAGTPREVSIRLGSAQRLSFPQWLYYKFTLRLDYLLNDIWRSAVHQARKSMLSRGLRAARSWSSLYQPCWEHVDRQLAELVIESSLMLGLTETWSDRASGHTYGRFVYSDWLCPASPRFRDEAVQIDRFEVVVDLDRRRAIGAEVNGRQIGAGQDALVLADLCVSVNFHTILHAYANRACVPNHPDPILASAAVFTAAMNAQAWHAGYFAMTVATRFRRVLERNSRHGMFAHGSGAMMRQIVRYSRTGAFLVEARKATMAVLREHRVDVDPEAYFLMSVLHSVDHHVIAAAVDPVNLHSGLLGYGGMEWIRVLFQEPLRPIFADTRISSQNTGWVADLYKRLSAIDPWYADRVDYCIRY